MSKDKDTAVPGVAADTLKSNEVARAVMGSGVKPDGFRVVFRDGVATLTGSVRTEDERKRVLEAARSVSGVGVKDAMTIGTGGAGGTAWSAAGGRTYTVKSGDTLSKIAKEHYGDATKYNRIFDANRNILSDPDKIQPGQVLAIPE